MNMHTTGRYELRAARNNRLMPPPPPQCAQYRSRSRGRSRRGAGPPRPAAAVESLAFLPVLPVLLLFATLLLQLPSSARADAPARRIVEVYQPFPFTPDGLIRQLQHAQQAVQRGSLSLALVGKDGVVLAGERRDRSPLLAPGPSPKIGALDKHVAYVMSGIAPDGRYLVRRGRLLSQRHWFEFGEEVGLPALLQGLSRVVTSAHHRAPSPAYADGGKRRDLLDEVRAQPSIDPLGEAEAEARKEGLPARHFGVGFLLAGPEHGYASPGCSLSPLDRDRGKQGAGEPIQSSSPPPPPPRWVLYEMGPSGMFLRWEARAIGEGSEKAEALLERLYRPGLSLEEAKRLAVRVCDSVLFEEEREGEGDDDEEEEDRPPSLEMAVLVRDEEGDPRLTRLTHAELRKLRAEVVETMGMAVRPRSAEIGQ